MYTKEHGPRFRRKKTSQSMYGPPDAVKDFYNKVSGAKLPKSSRGFYSFPCDNVLEVSFSWGGRSYAVTGNNFNLGQTETGLSTCVSALAAQDLGLGSNTWLLGDSFMKSVYTVEKTAIHANELEQNGQWFPTVGRSRNAKAGNITPNTEHQGTAAVTRTLYSIRYLEL
ncbi:hypothetical protein BDP27DRAFT_1366731 [Rhodocollybia butyracea]|uniref:Peptidase A1 domain-containing protein n=1 Tax=Rhodocollybia butyracea TaxID=206335 RepID=A0A9P5PN25_9AGAR|nr:hypothetical protein BDP27DRAFT_1366731 [Rhodocollybia butyracea]